MNTEEPATVRLVIGLMSGTSADSIDVALCETTGDSPLVRLLAFGARPMPHEVQGRVRRAGQLSVRDVAELGVLVGEAFAESCLSVIAEAGVRPDAIAAIGSHGQTLYHHGGPGSVRATLQVGDGDVIAERTGCLVVSDFRAGDIAAGGEGAPLTPFTDAILYGETPGRRVVLNLGGIANVTVLGPGRTVSLGFDTGPANAPLDRLARRLTDGRLDHDRDGAIARSGRVDEALLNRLLDADDYLTRRPPKSTGFEAYGDAFVDRASEWRGGIDADLMATLSEFTAASIAQALRDFIPPGPPLSEVIVAGGGLKNLDLMERIRARLAPLPVVPSDARGVPSGAREAMAFAVLADLAVRRVPCDLRAVTGATRPRVLGKVSRP